LGIPIGIGALVSALIVGFAVVPQWLRLQADSERLTQLEELKARIPMLRAQLAKTSASQAKAERNQAQLLQMIQGSGELATFLAQLDREATRLGVQLDLYEPVAAPPPPPPDAAKKGEAAPPPPQTPLEAAGLQAQKVLITAKGPYPNLLAFLRATEKLTVLVTQGNLSLTAVAPSSSTPAVAKTELKLTFTYYRSAPGVVTPPVAPPN
jgi:type IV pilus assembly protein PilO